MTRVEAVLRQRAREVAALHAGFNVRFRWNERAGDPAFRAPVPGCGVKCQTRRAFAWCSPGSDYPLIEAARRLNDQPDSRIEGVCRHELAHALQFWLGVPDHDHTERGTDELAELLWGEALWYDADLVQTVGSGVHRYRPPFLG